MRTAVAPGTREWVIKPPHAQRDALARDARIAPLLAQILLNRGLTTAADVHDFLRPDFKKLHPPELLPGAQAAAERLHAAIQARTPIAVYGDYDVDGITATTILWHTLREAGADVSFFIPSRFEEGYGLNGEALQQLKRDGAGLVITVDCGVTAVNAIAAAREAGLPIIVTDHHQPRETLPPAEVIVHPTAAGPSPNPDLCGAAVALKVAWALARVCSGGSDRVAPGWRELLLDHMAFAALGLIADLVPLTGENRIIATYGLKQLRHTRNPGLRALIDVSGLAEKAQYDDYDVGFKLAPRLNAVGRMGHARLAVEMLTRAGPDQARQIATTLDGQNRQRQQVERAIAKQAEEQVIAAGFDRDGCQAIVLASSEWHPGVIGIVASRLVDRFHRPTFLIALENGVGQGSGRSVAHFPLHEVLAGCRDHLIQFGGHAMAAGLKIAADQVSAFTNAFQAEAARRLTPKDLCPKLLLDDEVPLAALTTETVDAFLRLAPFGTGNARVRLATEPCELVGQPRVVGKTGNHLQFMIRSGQEQRKAIAFGRGKELDDLVEARRLRLAFEPIVNEWNGARRVELRVLDWKPAD